MPRRRDDLRVALLGGFVFALVFVAMESAWMRWVIGQAWPRARVLAGLPAALVTGAVMGGVGWVLGGFLRAQWTAHGAAPLFGDARRARWAARIAVVLVAAGLASTYRPQQFGPPMSVAELQLEAEERFPVQEALFWDAVIHDDWGRRPDIAFYSEGTMDGIPLPVGPAWCAADAAGLERELPYVRFALRVNGDAVDLRGHPISRRRLSDGRECAWIAVVSRRQRASQNHFVYTITPAEGAPPTLRPIRVDATVVFKDP
jgi:hypothetical protein